MTERPNEPNLPPAAAHDDEPDAMPTSAFERHVSRWMSLLFGLLGCALTYGAVRMLFAGLAAPHWPSGLTYGLPAMLAAAGGVSYGSYRLWRNAGRE